MVPINSIQLTGRLTRDPELRQIPGGDPVCKIRIAVDGLAAKRETGYIDVTCFGKAGEAAARVLTKGWLVAVDGRLQHDTWMKDDEKRSTYSVVGQVEFLAAPKSDATEHESDADIAF